MRAARAEEMTLQKFFRLRFCGLPSRFGLRQLTRSGPSRCRIDGKRLCSRGFGSGNSAGHLQRLNRKGHGRILRPNSGRTANGRCADGGEGREQETQRLCSG